MIIRGINENIARLEELCSKHITRNKFNPPPDIELLDNIEAALGIFLPHTYRDFIRKFNGGMLLEHDESYYIDMTDWEPDGPKYSNYYFFSLDELVEKYEEIRYSSQILTVDLLDVSPIIPICSTPDQEIIALLTQKGMKIESPVFVIKDIEDMSTYYMINNSFIDFLDHYINENGLPDLGKYETNKPMSMFIHDKGLHFQWLKEEPSNEKLYRLSSMIKIQPKESIYYCNRGIAFLDLGERQKALIDFNTAIELDPESSFARYCRGDLLYEYGSARKALIDMDIAVKLTDNDNFYLAGRAKIFLKLNKLNKALADCNKILESDDTDILALSTRCRVYGAMGEHEKADADNSKLEELYGD